MPEIQRAISDLGVDGTRISITFSGRYHNYDDLNLTSLVGSIRETQLSFRCRNNQLINLHGSPTIVNGAFIIDHNQKLLSLDGGPVNVSGYYAANNCNILDLDHLPDKIGEFLSLSYNPLISLKGINKLKEMSGYIYLEECNIKSHILGVFFIKGCKGIMTSNATITDFVVATNILNRHIRNGRPGLLPCTQELIEAGLADFAQI